MNNGYTDYDDDSDADDEYERSMKSPAVQGEFSSSPTESDGHHSAEQTPTYHRTAPMSPTGLVTKWNADQTADWVANMGFEQYADSFAENEIDGAALIELLHDELEEMGIVSIGHRLTILREIYEIKVRHNVPILPDHYVPLSSDANAPDAHATQDDVARIIKQIHLRDERLLAAEEDLRILRDDLNRALEESRRLREDTLPLIRNAKDKNQPLPTPDINAQYADPMSSPQSNLQSDNKPTGLSRKYSTKKLFMGGVNNQGKIPSPTLHESSSLDPSAAAKAASSQLSASMTSQGSQNSPRMPSQPSPTSPPYMQQHQSHSIYRSAPSSRYAPSSVGGGEDVWSHSSTSTIATDRFPPGRDRRTPGLSAISSTSSFADEMTQTSRHRAPAGGNDPSGGMEFMKSFRVSMEEPCYKVLPVALRKYQIDDDWQKYSLYIVHGDQERCLGLNEKPLILFKQLASEGKKPMFMLRKHAAPQEGFMHERGTGDTGGGPPAGVGSLGTGAQGFSGTGRASYAPSSVHLPGGVL